MSEIAKAISKKPVSKSENSVSHTRQIASSQSINSPVDKVMYLQRMAGNQAVQRLIRSGALQAKLRIGTPGDVFEQEADRVAAQVMSMPIKDNAGVGEGLKQNNNLACSNLASDESLKRQRSDYTKPACSDNLGACDFGGKSSRFLIQRSAVLPSIRDSYDSSIFNAGIQSEIISLQGKGHLLSNSALNFFETRFGHDFSNVRIHTDTNAGKLAKALNARAFAIGQNVVFESSYYSPETAEGRKLLAHELAHVVQQDRRILNNDQINRWAAEDHGKITEEIINANFKNDFSNSAKESIAYYSGDMDIRGCNYLWFAPPKIPIVGLPVKASKPYKYLAESEAPNHGEANLYKYTNRTGKNKIRMNEYKEKAIKLVNKDGVNDKSLLELGFALHVGQDRGAHEEGLPGKGHSKTNWKPDDLSKNTAGVRVAKVNSSIILKEFLQNLDVNKRKQIKTGILPGKSVSGGIELSTGAAFTGSKQLFYIGMAGYGVLPNRILGIWSPVLKAGYGYAGGEKHILTVTEEFGLRLTRISPRIYVDVLTGAAFGVNFTDKSFMAGISATVQAHYTGNKADLGIMLNNVHDFVGKRNVLVVGVTARW